jgi:four helix bundle protein
MTIVEEEADETIYWLELLAEAGIVKLDIIQPLLREADELLAITISSIRTAKQNRK